jgi:hypothetical protein
MIKNICLFGRFFIPFVLIMLMMGCFERQAELVSTPSNIFTLLDEVMAVKCPGKSGKVIINLDPLRQKIKEFDDVLVLEYKDETVQREISYKWVKMDIEASLVEDTVYLVYVRPKDRIYDIYYVLCVLDVHREDIDRLSPGLIDQICKLILCSAEPLFGRQIFEKFPQIKELQKDMDVDDRQIGGWGTPVPRSVCERCTMFKTPGLVFPMKPCWARKKPLVKVVNMIPNTLSGETCQDSEPFLAVDNQNTNQMAASAFTPNPFGTSGNAPIYISSDSGNTWQLCMIVPSHGSLGTGDITIATSNQGSRLFGGILRIPGDLLMNILRTDDFTSDTSAMTVLDSRSYVDQPFVQAITVVSGERIYVGNNDFNATNSRTATIDVSLDGGTTFNSVRIETRNTPGQNGPSIRPAVSRDGTIYGAYFGWRNYSNSIATSDVVVARDDNGATGTNPFQDLTDPSDGQPGRIVAQGVTIPWSNAPTLGFERIGSTLSIAVQPTNSAVVYVSWADRVGNGDIYTIHVRRSIDRGVSWSNDLRSITNATCCALAVADNGTVGFLYQQYTRQGDSDYRWVTHLELSGDAFKTIDGIILANVPGNSPQRQFLPYIGDYNFMLTVGNEFRGIFSANNYPDLNNFPNGVKYQRLADFNTKSLSDSSGNFVAVSIDPFYFSVRVK